jgi:hypothetical protein
MKPGATTADFNTDRYNCFQSSAQATPPSAGLAIVGNNIVSYDVNANTRDQLFSACMVARGWSLQRQQQKSSDSYGGSVEGFRPVSNASLQSCCSENGGLALDKYDARICSNAHLLCADHTASECSCE